MANNKSGRPMVPANYDKMTQEQLIDNYKKVLKTLEEQRANPNAEWIPTMEATVKSYEEQLRKRGISTEDINTPTNSKPRLRPVGEPTDIGTSVGSPGAPKVNQPYSPKKAPGLSEPKRKFLVDEKGNTILVDEAAEQVKAQIKHDINKIPRSNVTEDVTKASIKKRSLKSGASIADQVVKGAKNAKDLRVAGIAALLGVGGLGYSKIRNNMQERNSPTTRNGPINQGY